MSVIERARQILALHESAEHSVSETLSPHPAPVQIRLFEPDSKIAERLRAAKLDELRPIDALQLLSELQEELKHP
jgi:DNA mismatch repair protein MutS